MNIKISFRGMDHSDSAENYVKKALEDKVFKLLEKEPEPIKIEVLLEAHRAYTHHKVEIRMHSKHNHFMVEHEGDDLYVEIVHVIKVLAQDIKKSKSKYLDQRKDMPEIVQQEDIDEDSDL